MDALDTILARTIKPLRIEFDGALYQVTSRGDRREVILHDGEDYRRHSWCKSLKIVARDCGSVYTSTSAALIKTSFIPLIYYLEKRERLLGWMLRHREGEKSKLNPRDQRMLMTSFRTTGATIIDLTPNFADPRTTSVRMVVASTLGAVQSGIKPVGA